MKNGFTVALTALLMTIPLSLPAQTQPVTISDLALEGEIEGENITFNLSFKANVDAKNTRLPLVVGDVAFLDGKFPRKSELLREKDEYGLVFKSTGEEKVAFRFASRAAKDGDWRQTSFSIPGASIRKISVLCDRDDLEVRFPGALDVTRAKVKDEKSKPEAGKPEKTRTKVTAFLGISNKFEVRWKPEVKKLDSELMVTGDANTIATASVGALRLDTILTYRIIQGSLSKLSIKLPDINVIQVRGEDIQDWRIDKAKSLLTVTLGRPQEEVYRLQVESEMMLPKFPTSFRLPVLTPENALRTSGFVMVGTDSAIKLQVNKAAGLTQVDPSSFPAVMLVPAKPEGRKDAGAPLRPTPRRSTYAYQYANTPYTLDLKADDVVSSFSADDLMALSLDDNELTFKASVQVDIKDAPAREILIETDTNASWTVTSVTGRHVAETDTDVRDEKGRRVIYVPFKQAVLGVTLIDMTMERTLKPNEKSFRAPAFKVLEARSERGCLVVAAEKGVRLKAEEMSGLREVHTGSAPVKVAGAQQAFRFKDPGWRLKMSVERTLASIHSEVFHLVSLGDGMMYCTATITYNIGGAPVQEFRLRVPKTIEQVEFTGSDIEGWTRAGEVCTVRLQTKIMGDYTLLVTYDKQFDPARADILVAGIETMGAETEMGYVALASRASLSLTEKALPASMFKIDKDEMPYPVNDPILSAYKYVATPHAAVVQVEPYRTEQLLGQIADYVKMETRVSKDGESETTVRYFVKNASAQHLVVTLPQGAKLWTIKYVGENGQKQDVLSQRAGNKILIPVRRPRDPNTALEIELVYAQSLRRLGFWTSGMWGLNIAGPSLPDAHSTFADWLITVPDNFSIAQAGGNMTSLQESGPGGLIGVGQKLWNVVLAVADGWGDYTIWEALTGDWPGTSVQELSRTVNLSGGPAPTIDLVVVPTWMGSESSAVGLAGAGILGVVVVASGMRRRRSALIALGLTVLIYAVSQAAAGRFLLALTILLILLGLFLFKGGLRLAWRFVKWMFSGWRHWRGSSQKPGGGGEPPPIPASDDGQPPFEPEGGGGTPNVEYRMLNGGAAGERSEVRGQRSEVREQKSEVREQRSEVGDQRSEVGDQRSEGRDQKSEGGGEGADLKSEISDAPGNADDTSSKKGGTAPALLCLMLAAAVGVSGALAEKPAAPAAAPVMDFMQVTIEGPGSGRDVERSANITQVLEFKTDHPVSFVVLPCTSVLKGYELGSSDLEITSRKEGYVLNVKADGKYKVTLKSQAPVEEKNGQWSLAVYMPENMKNRVTLKLPEPGFDVQSEEAVLFRTEEKEKSTEVEAVFGPAREANFKWKPRVRKTKLEETVFFCEANTYVALQSGVVDLTHLVRFQIAQGEVKGFKVKIPANMSVTAVQAQRLATWSFDPDTRLLDAILEGPVTGEFPLIITTQISCEGLPYSTTIGALQVMGASRQRGSIALAAPDTVQLKIGETKGLNAMNIEDFASAAVALATSKKQAERAPLVIRRSFRYHQAEEVSVAVQTERVLAEVRVNEMGSVTISDERILLTTALELSVAKAGIFSVDLIIPKDFDIETLTGNDVSHWDEAGAEDKGTEPKTAKAEARPAADGSAAAENAEGDGRVVTVNFNKQVTGTTGINLVIARMEKGIESKIMVPEARIRDAKKHTGRLTVAAEKGIRLMVANHNGVDAKKASEEGIHQAGVLVFHILRPNWTIELKAEVMAPVVKPEVLQWVDLMEGMLQCKAYIRYKIENAGVKTFRVKSPVPGITLSVAGKGIARVSETDKQQGLWQVDLHNKQENEYAMRVEYQIPYEREKKQVRILPLKTVDTEGQRGYLVVTCAGRVQVKDQGDTTGLKVDDPRNIPAAFKAGDLSNAIKCYRTDRADYALELSVVRHGSADVLPASIESAQLTSVLSPSGQQLVQGVLRMTVGDLRLLKVTLPNPSDSLWTALVNGKVVSTSRDKDLYCIPLDKQEGSQEATVELVYAGSQSSGLLNMRHRYDAPRFEGLPLRKMEWTFYVLPGMEYFGFGGTLDKQEAPEEVSIFSLDQYEGKNKAKRDEAVLTANKVLNLGAEMAKAGKQRQAKQLYQQAVDYSAGQADLNEDARVQYHNLQKQQVKLGLVNRRGNLRIMRNIGAESPQEEQQQPEQQTQGFRDGEYTQDYVNRVERGLSAKDNKALEIVAEKIINQQAAAAGVVNAIQVTIPQHGKKLCFGRLLQIDPKGELSVKFWTRTIGLDRMLRTAAAAGALFLFFWWMVARRKKAEAR